MSEFFRSSRVPDGCENCAWFFHPQYDALTARGCCRAHTRPAQGLGSFWAQGQGWDPRIRVQGLGFSGLRLRDGCLGNL